MTALDTVVILVVSIAVGFGLAHIQRWIQARWPRRQSAATFSDPGIAVEYKNPFGDITGGRDDAAITATFGVFAEIAARSALRRREKIGV